MNGQSESDEPQALIEEFKACVFERKFSPSRNAEPMKPDQENKYNRLLASIFKQKWERISVCCLRSFAAAESVFIGVYPWLNRIGARSGVRGKNATMIHNLTHLLQPQQSG